MTPVQLKLLTFICDFTDKHGVSPCFDEMAHGIGLASKSGIPRVLGGLQHEGWIGRTEAIQRDVVILRRPASRDPYAIDRLASLDPAKFEQLALNIVTLRARRAA